NGWIVGLLYMLWCGWASRWAVVRAAGAIGADHHPSGATPGHCIGSTAAERPAHQPPQAHHKSRQNANDLVRAAVGCMGVFGAPAVVGYERAEFIYDTLFLLHIY